MKKDLKKTNIVCTIGPASDPLLKELMLAGMNMARMNFSHGSYPEQQARTEDFLRIREELGLPVALLLDMQGPEVRTGKLEEPVILEAGDTFTLVNNDIIGNKEKTSVSYKNLYQDVEIGTRILIDDGLIEIEVTKIDGKDIVCKVINGGKLGHRKSINVPGIALKLPGLSPKDIQDLKDGARIGFDYVAGSFVRNVEDVRNIRKVLDENGGKDVKIICKIENQEGIDNIEEIIKESDGIMVARGDMAVEIPLEEVPVVQKNFIKMCNKACKPVITATQMLESMTHNPRPTRAEVSDVANAVYDRTGSIMLSGECAMGEYPVQCVEVMSKVSKKVESTINYWKRFKNSNFKLEEKDLKYNVVYSACDMARNINADAIVAYTETGNSVRTMAGMGAGCPVFAITNNKKLYNQLAIIWNVFPVLVEDQEHSIEERMEMGIEKLKADGILEAGDTIVISGGSKVLEHASQTGKTTSTVLKLK